MGHKGPSLRSLTQANIKTRDPGNKNEMVRTLTNTNENNVLRDIPRGEGWYGKRGRGQEGSRAKLLGRLKSRKRLCLRPSLHQYQ